VHYVIADGVEAMEGNGPFHGLARHLGRLVFADAPLTADSTCCSMIDWIARRRMRSWGIPVAARLAGGFTEVSGHALLLRRHGDILTTKRQGVAPLRLRDHRGVLVGVAAQRTTLNRT
jgi:hypothetical protein